MLKIIKTTTIWWSKSFRIKCCLTWRYLCNRRRLTWCHCVYCYVRLLYHILWL